MTTTDEPVLTDALINSQAEDDASSGRRWAKDNFLTNSKQDAYGTGVMVGYQHGAKFARDFYESRLKIAIEALKSWLEFRDAMVGEYAWHYSADEAKEIEDALAKIKEGKDA